MSPSHLDLVMAVCIPVMQRPGVMLKNLATIQSAEISLLGQSNLWPLDFFVRSALRFFFLTYVVCCVGFFLVLVDPLFGSVDFPLGRSPLTVRSSHPLSSFVRSQRGGSAEVICRASQGVFMGSSAIVIAGVWDAATLEAIACWEAIALVEDLNQQQLIVASDYKQVTRGPAESSSER